jgi:ATP-dependent RNA helicase DeaD
MKFSELELKPELLQSLEKIGYHDMTPIQEESIPHIMEGADVLGLAETGSGKTSACAVPLVQNTDPELNAIQALIVVPTRELALQYVQEVDDVATGSGVVPFAIYGGFDMSIQKAKLRHKVHILVATPGRLIDFLWNTDLDLTHVKTVVLDEADEMLNMGFIEDIDFIMSCMIHPHQNLLFSATMPREIERLTTTYLNEPRRIQLNKDQKAPQSLDHHFRLSSRDRLGDLKTYLKDQPIKQAIVFCNSRDKGSQLFSELRRAFPSVDYIHGGLDQDRRTSIFTRFREGKIKFMVATDVAGRGLDFSKVSHVLNFDFPLSLEAYTHRTGRTGRMGRQGTAYTLITERDLRSVKRLIQTNGIVPIWDGEEPDLDKAPSGRGGSPRRRGPGGSNGNKSGGGGSRRRGRSSKAA